MMLFNFDRVFGLVAAVAVASSLTGAVRAQPVNSQMSPQRTWPELREAVQQRVDRNAYPLTGMKADDVREILTGINSLDRDEWAAAWTRMGTRYAEKAAQLAATDREASHEAYM